MEDKFNLLPIREWISTLGLSTDYTNLLRMAILLVIVVILAWLADYIAKKFLLVVIKKVVSRSKTQWDDVLFKRNVFGLIAHLLPGAVVYMAIPGLFVDFNPKLLLIAKDLVSIYILIIILLIGNAFLNSVKDIYNQLEISKNRPITGYIQVVKIIIYSAIIIWIISIIINKNPFVLLTGLGAMAAVILLVFKDTILGFVASIQLSANDMVRPGDWISMPKYHADGTVMEITLNTVKVQNWDKTISMIPTYALVSDSFNNWRGMEESGGRRIKRSINIDMNSIQFCSEDQIQKLKKIELLSDYIENKLHELKEANTNSESIFERTRKITNIGSFRIYIEKYIRAHPKINKDMTLLIRQLAPGPEGIPIEIYAFSAIQEWADYEAIQADIFDHLLAFTPEFDLKVFQHPSGQDFRSLRN